MWSWLCLYIYLCSVSGVIVGVVLAVSVDILVFCARSHRRCGPGCVCRYTCVLCQESS